MEKPEKYIHDENAISLKKGKYIQKISTKEYKLISKFFADPLIDKMIKDGKLRGRYEAKTELSNTMYNKIVEFDDLVQRYAAGGTKFLTSFNMNKDLLGKNN